MFGTKPLMVVGVLFAAAGLGLDQVFKSNQNTYLLHAVGPTMLPLREDWLLTTIDPFPLFTAVAQAGYLVGGRWGLAVESFLVEVAMFAGLALIARALLNRATPVARESVTAIAVLATSACTYLLPKTEVPVLSWIHPFQGFGGQYLTSIPAMFQASDCGAFLLLGVGVAAWSQQEMQGRARTVWRLVAAALAALGCLLHPTYLAPLAVVLAAMMFADLVIARTGSRIGWYVGTGVLTVGLSLLLNPVVSASIASEPTPAQAYLAFDRIAHHTLLSRWDPHDVIVAIVVLMAAGMTVVLVRGWWAAAALVLALVVAICAAAYVQLSRDLTVAMMFPWRVTVLLMPISVLVGWVWLIDLLARRVGRLRVWVMPSIVVLSASCVGVGGFLTVTASDPNDGAAVRAVRGVAPTGVGLIPISLQDVRLNAPASIYVDFKSNPYTPEDLAEWVGRLNAARLTETNDAELCKLVDSAGLDWVMLRPRRSMPTCLSSWRPQRSEGFDIYTRPRP